MDPTGTDAAKPAIVFLTTASDAVGADPTGTDATAPATRFVATSASDTSEEAEELSGRTSGETQPPVAVVAH